MESLIKTQSTLLEAIQKIEVNFRKDGPSRKTAEYIQARLDKLEEYWRDFQTNHIEILNFENKEIPYFEDDVYPRVKKLYENIKQIIKSWVLENPREVVRGETETAPPKVGIKSSDEQNLLFDLISKQKSNFRAFHRYVESFDIGEIQDQWEFQEKLDCLKEKWNGIDKLYWEVDYKFPGGNDIYETEYFRQEELFKSLKNLLSKKIASGNEQVKLAPRVRIPIFSGKYDEWTTFHDLFQETIHKNQSFSNAQRMQHLKGSLRGEAEKLIQHLSVSSENYITAWEILLNRYCNRRLLFTTLISKLLDHPTIPFTSADKIKKLHDCALECINGISNLEIDISTWDPILVHHITRKLDSTTHREYLQSLHQPRELQPLSGLLSFLETRFMAIEASYSKNKFEQRNNVPEQRKPQFQKLPFYNHQKSYPFRSNNAHNSTFKSATRQPTTQATYEEPRALATVNNQCSFCKGDHKITQCTDFANVSTIERSKFTNDNKLCRNCLGRYHEVSTCLSSKRCKKCNGLHNTLLHSDSVEKKVTSNKISSNSLTQQNQVLLPTARVMVMRSDGTFISLRALVDQGSQVNLITENAAQQLSLKRKFKDVSVTGLGENSSCKSRGLVHLQFKAIYNDHHIFSTDAVIMQKLTGNLPQISFNNQCWSHLNNLELADPDYNISNQIDILLGANILADILEDGIIRTDSGQPIAQRTKLGWIISGKFSTSYHCMVINNNTNDITRFWEIEEVNNEVEPVNNYCEDFYLRTTTRTTEGRYVVRLPMLPDAKKVLGESKQIAYSRFLQVEKKINSDMEYGKEYKEFMKNYLELNHMQLATNPTSSDNYLPHHGVWKLDSTTTRLRVVFDGSARTKTGRSLNSCLHTAPNLQKDIQGILLKWRTFKYAFTADIAKMFRQILIHPEDRHLQKIIWRESKHERLQEYELCTVVYGTSIAPFLALRCLQQLADDDGHLYPKAAEVLRTSFYMDDCISGGKTIEEAQTIQRDLLELLNRGGFMLRQWSSNSLQLVENLDESLRNPKIDFVDDCANKILGIHWIATTDTLTFKLDIEELNNNIKITKRRFLSDFSKIYDPQGIIGPVILKIKIIFQQVWLHNLNWDDELPHQMQIDWLNLRSELPKLSEVGVNRWIGCTEEPIEIHGFCDASEKAYAAVVYSRVIKEDGRVCITLLTSKSKICPVKKKISLPRLELSGAYLLAELITKVSKYLQPINHTIHLWTDSTVTLGWLAGNPNRWKTFVANRVSKIKAQTAYECWKYVPSKENPADVASRGATPVRLLQMTLWWKGPQFLHDGVIPNQPLRIEPTSEDLKKARTHNVIHSQPNILFTILSNHSNITTVYRVIAWIKRFITRCNGKNRTNQPRFSELRYEEIAEASKLLIRFIQHERYEEEIKALRQGKPLPKRSEIYDLNPYLDEETMLRVGGRISSSLLNDESKHPLIIPNNHHLTILILKQAHLKVLHGGPTQTLSYTRRKYWIIGGTRAAKSYVRKCVTCHRFSNIPIQNQQMSSLPKARVIPSKPFTYCIIDYAGPVDIKANKGRGTHTIKGYISVFVCLFSKAVHLEVVMGLDTESFLAAFRRMCSRRGTPNHVYSDNGRNFVGANRVLQKDETTQINWHFMAPHWPNACGLAEAAVKSMKFHMKRIIGTQKLTYEEMATFICQVEACLNSRPLCSLKEHPENLDILTPGHFLIGAPLNALPTNDNLCGDLRIRWNMIEKMKITFWRKWQSEYLTSIQKRTKWQAPINNIRIGDIVLIKEDNMPPLQWSRGRVVDVHPGRDGLVRVVSIKTQRGILKRPVCKLSLLPIPDNTASEINQLTEGNDDNTSTSMNDDTATNQRRYNLRTRGKVPCFNLFALVILSFCAILIPSNALQKSPDISINSFQKSPGIYFEKVGELKRTLTTWKIVYYYNMTSYWANINNLKTTINDLEKNCNQLIKNNFPCTLISENLKRNVLELDHNNDILQNHHFLVRKKRGYINAIGSISRTLFGILDDNFAQKYEEDIAHLKENDQYLLELIKNQTIVVEAENNIIKRQEESINNQTITINAISKQLTAEITDVESDITELIRQQLYLTIVTSANQMYETLKDIQSSLIEYVTDAYKGHVSPHLIHAELLRKELTKVMGQLPSGLNVPVKNINDNIKDIYQLISVHTRLSKNYLLLQLSLPLTDDELFNLFQPIPVPIEINKNIFVIRPTADFIAINMQHDTFIMLSHFEFQACVHMNSGEYLCNSNLPVNNIHHYQKKCEIQIINEEKPTDCNLQPMELQETWTRLINDQWLYFCKEECRFSTICGNSVVSHKQIHGTGLIQLREGCLLKTKAVTIFSSRRIEEQLSLTTLTLSHSPRNDFTLPLTNHSVPDIVSNLTLLSHNRTLTEIDKKIEEMKKANLNNVSYHDVHHYAANYTLLCIAVGIICYLAVRHRCARGTQPSGVIEMQRQRTTPATSPDLPSPAVTPTTPAFSRDTRSLRIRM